MGVKDLRSIILRHAPAAVQPHSFLSAFSHSTFAIDANLLTTKFHHVLPSSYALRRSSLSPELLTRHRHVRAWYYFLLALKREDIRPIVVFDGATRLPEKEKENARRRQTREQQRERGEAERKRGERLGELKGVWEEVLEEDRMAVARGFREGVGGVQEEQVEGRSPAAKELTSHLLALYESFQDDARNPVYSKNQDLLAADESAFFQRVLDAQTEGLQAAEQSSLDDLSSRSTALGLSHLKRATSVPQSAYDDIIVHPLPRPHSHASSSLSTPGTRPSSRDPPHPTFPLGTARSRRSLRDSRLPRIRRLRRFGRHGRRSLRRASPATDHDSPTWERARGRREHAGGRVEEAEQGGDECAGSGETAEGAWNGSRDVCRPGVAVRD